MDEVTKRITNDQADEACDKIEFVAEAIAQMMGSSSHTGSYSDNIVCGCMNILLESADLLREYTRQRLMAGPAPRPEGDCILDNNMA